MCLPHVAFANSNTTSTPHHPLQNSAWQQCRPTPLPAPCRATRARLLNHLLWCHAVDLLNKVSGLQSTATAATAAAASQVGTACHKVQHRATVLVRALPAETAQQLQKQQNPPWQTCSRATSSRESASSRPRGSRPWRYWWSASAQGLHARSVASPSCPGQGRQTILLPIRVHMHACAVICATLLPRRVCTLGAAAAAAC